MSQKLALVLVPVLLWSLSCRPEEPAPSTEAAEPAPAAAEATEPLPAALPAAASESAPSATGSPASEAPASTRPAAASLASQETNWPGVAAEVTEFRRKGNTLTAKVLLRNQGTDPAETEINYKEVYLMDLGGGKKYEVLRDEKGNYIAALRSGWSDRWYEKLEPGRTVTVWMKFPAPPADVRSVTLQVPGVLPFEDLPIEDV